MTTRSIARYGWRPQLPDIRDLRLTVAPPQPDKPLPPLVDLSPLLPAPYDQGDLGACTAHALAALVQFQQRHEGLIDFMPSRLFIYYFERALEGTIPVDAGGELRDGIKAIAAQGVCREELWPYVPAQFTVSPPPYALQRALLHRALRYQAPDQDLHTLRAVLAGGQPFAFGFTAYESFESDAVAASGVLPMPAPQEAVVGGHAVVAVGYDDARRAFRVRNSWGPVWGDRGHFWMPYTYMTSPDLAGDFWVITGVGAG